MTSLASLAVALGQASPTTVLPLEVVEGVGSVQASVGGTEGRFVVGFFGASLLRGGFPRKSLSVAAGGVKLGEMRVRPGDPPVGYDGILGRELWASKTLGADISRAKPSVSIFTDAKVAEAWIGPKAASWPFDERGAVAIKIGGKDAAAFLSLSTGQVVVGAAVSADHRLLKDWSEPGEPPVKHIATNGFQSALGGTPPLFAMRRELTAGVDAVLPIVGLPIRRILIDGKAGRVLAEP